MAGELNSFYTGSNTLYAVIRRESDGYVWGGSSFAAFSNGSIATYASVGALTSQGGDYYSADLPSGVSAGTVLHIAVYENTGTAAITDLLIKSYGLTAGAPSTSPSASGEDLITLAEMKTFLNISSTTYDSLLTALITASSYALMKYCEKDSFKATTYSGTIANGNGLWYFCFPNTPVTAISSVIIGYNDSVPRTYAGTVFDYESTTGEFRFKPTATSQERFASGFRNLSLSYTAGLSSIPSDLKLICERLVKYYYQQTTINSALKSETIGDYKYENFQPMIQAGLDSDPALDSVRTMLVSGSYYRSHVLLD